MRPGTDSCPNKEGENKATAMMPRQQPAKEACLLIHKDYTMGQYVQPGATH